MGLRLGVGGGGGGGSNRTESVREKKLLTVSGRALMKKAFKT